MCNLHILRVVIVLVLEVDALVIGPCGLLNRGILCEHLKPRIVIVTACVVKVLIRTTHVVVKDEVAIAFFVLQQGRVVRVKGLGHVGNGVLHIFAVCEDHVELVDRGVRLSEVILVSKERVTVLAQGETLVFSAEGRIVFGPSVSVVDFESSIV